MKFSWSDLTASADFYNFCAVRSLNPGEEEHIKYHIVFKADNYEATVYVKYENITEFNVHRALEVESIYSNNAELVYFLRQNEDAILALCNVFHNAWHSGFHAGFNEGMI